MTGKVSVVTSFSARGWKEYGQRFCDTFTRHWPPGVALYAVSEDMGRLRLWDESPAARAFHERHKDNPLAHGRVQRAGDYGWTPKKIAAGYNFRLDAYRFAKKVFAVQIAAHLAGGGRLFWVDADVLTFAPVPAELFARVLPDEAALACLDRGTYHSECGFVGYNLEHEACGEFIAEFARLYASGEVFGLKEWHDSWVFDHTRKRMGIPTHAIPHCSRHHPFVNSELGRYMDHLKGSRKSMGRTPAHEMLAGFGGAYWRGAA